jgi:hypothetical protein
MIRLRKGEGRALGDGDRLRFAVGVEGVVRVARS